MSEKEDKIDVWVRGWGKLFDSEDQDIKAEDLI